jgi:endonuclease-3 related protein
MSSFSASFNSLVSALAQHYGPFDRPEPSGIPFTSLATVFLERSLGRAKAEQAIVTLEDAGLLEPSALASADLTEVRDILQGRGVGVQPKDLAPLLRIADWLSRFENDSRDLESSSTSDLQEELVGLKGIGQTTADALLLFGLHRPSYPVDRASYRILVRHGWSDPTVDYPEVRDLIVQAAEADSELLANLSHWLEKVGREYCRASLPRCERCPLCSLLPEGGPLSPDC